MTSLEELLYSNFYQQDTLIETGMKPKRNNIKYIQWDKIKDNVEKHEKIFDILNSFSFEKKLSSNEEDSRIENLINSSFK
jgi:hypothetical protein